MTICQGASDLVPESSVELRGVYKSFHAEGRSVKALDDVFLSVEEGEFLTLIGPSGCGKSTLFNLVVGLLQPDEGNIYLEGEICADRIGRVSYMPQRDLLLPWRNILDNVIIPLELAGVPRGEARARAQSMLPLFGLEDFASSYPAALSGGMRQRAALQRTMLAEKRILLLDEPFGALDALTRRELQDWLLEVWRRFGQTVIFITHDVEEAIYLGDRVAVMSPRPGRIVKTVDVPLPRPRRQTMTTEPVFSSLLAELLEALGITI
ncbi:MAG: ABC transporter ATP-binding protein [Anaerolineales bacterium]|nr:ABC transporter ATP-binding protein [Anaerolineales bacterium]